MTEGRRKLCFQVIITTIKALIKNKEAGGKGDDLMKERISELVKNEAV